jgi:hypothetical protein
MANMDVSLLMLLSDVLGELIDLGPAVAFIVSLTVAGILFKRKILAPPKRKRSRGAGESKSLRDRGLYAPVHAICARGSLYRWRRRARSCLFVFSERTLPCSMMICCCVRVFSRICRKNNKNHVLVYYLHFTVK